MAAFTAAAAGGSCPPPPAAARAAAMALPITRTESYADGSYAAGGPSRRVTSLGSAQSRTILMSTLRARSAAARPAAESASIRMPSAPYHPTLPSRGNASACSATAAKSPSNPMNRTAAWPPPTLEAADADAAAMPASRRAATSVQFWPASANATRVTLVSPPMRSAVAASMPRPHESFRTATTRSVTDLLSEIMSPRTIPRRLSGAAMRNRLSPGTASEGAVEEGLIRTMPLALAYGRTRAAFSLVEGPTYRDGPLPLAYAALRPSKASGSGEGAYPGEMRILWTARSM